MNIICIKKTNVSDVIYIKSNPVVGIIALTSFLENLSGVTVSSYFISKSFRYSIDGINYSDWLTFDSPTLTSLSFSEKDTVIFELAYKKIATDPSLEVVDIQLVSNDQDPNYDETYFTNSIFSEFFQSSSLEVLNWYINVLQKIYRRGLIPNYLERLNEFNKDEDFIEFWRSIAKFFSFFVVYARKYEKFYEVESLLEEYLQQRGLSTSLNDTLTELQYLMSNFYREVLKRGSIHIIDNKYKDNSLEVNGELLRLISYKEEDEFLFNLHKLEHFGWNLGNSSPLWRGLQQNQSLHKVQSYLNPSTSNSEITVNPYLSYNLNFYIQLPSTKALRVKVIGFDINNVTTSLIDYTTGIDSINNCILEDVRLQRDDKAIFFQGIIYGVGKTPFIDGTTNLNQGSNLIFKSEIVKIKIHIETVDVSSLVLPFLSRVATDFTLVGNLNYQTNFYSLYPSYTNYSHGIVQVPNWISCWLTNNEHTLSIHQVKQFIRRFLIPYNSHLELCTSFDTGVEEEEVVIPQNLGWRGINPLCEFIEVIEEVYYDPTDPVCEQEGDLILPYYSLILW